MIRRRQRRHLMSVPRVLKEEVLHFLRNLEWGEERAPLVHELREHAPRAALLNLAQPSEDGELVVRHAHIGLVRLNVVLCDRLELGGGHGFQESAAGSAETPKANQGAHALA